MDPASLEFARPVWLYAGVGLCVLVLVLWIWFDRKRDADLSRLVHSRFRSRLLPGLSRGLLRAKRSLWLVGVLFLCTAAAGPQMGYEWREVRQRGIDILFAVDTSRSMLAEDLSPNRLERARMGIEDFVERLHGDRVGLIPFAGSSFVMCPLTTDYDAFLQGLRTLQTDIIPRQGTDVASAVREANRLFEEQKNNHRILVLMTDGEDFEGDVEDAIKEAKDHNMIIHTVGVGSAEGARIPQVSPEGHKDHVRDDSGNIVVTKLDENTLKHIAEGTGGLYAPLGRSAGGLEMIYKEKLRLMPQEEREAGMEKIPLERYGWPLAAGLLLLLVEFLLPDRRSEPKVRALPSAARRHATAGLVLLSGALFPREARAEEDARILYNAGTAAYEAGDFAKAADSLRASLRTTDLKLQARAYYNLGNTLYRTGQAAEKSEDKTKSWEAAVKAYDDALALNAGDADARYNRDLVQRKLDAMKNQSSLNGQGGKDGKENDEKKADEEKKGEQKQDGQNGEGQENQQQKDKSEQSEDQKGQEGNQQQGEKQEGQNQQPGEKEKQGQEGQSNEQKEAPDGEKKEQSAGAGGEEKKDEMKEGAREQSAEQKDPAGGNEKDKEKATGQKGGDQKEGEKKEGAQQLQNGEQKNAQQVDEQDATPGERRKAGEMTSEEARQLLKTLRTEEATVLPFEPLPPRQRRYGNPRYSTNGKTW